MSLMSERSWDDWIHEYAQSHQHPVNRRCHLIGIPSIVVALVISPAGFFWSPIFVAVLVLFAVGWVFQFIGHAYEGKPPEFFKDWRFLLVGTRWWWWKVRQKTH